MQHTKLPARAPRKARSRARSKRHADAAALARQRVRPPALQDFTRCAEVAGSPPRAARGRRACCCCVCRPIQPPLPLPRDVATLTGRARRWSGSEEGIRRSYMQTPSARGACAAGLRAAAAAASLISVSTAAGTAEDGRRRSPQVETVGQPHSSTTALPQRKERRPTAACQQGVLPSSTASRQSRLAVGWLSTKVQLQATVAAAFEQLMLCSARRSGFRCHCSRPVRPWQGARPCGTTGLRTNSNQKNV
eukprot:365359-Chlamydomonas_euryale.AAC.1